MAVDRDSFEVLRAPAEARVDGWLAHVAAGAHRPEGAERQGGGAPMLEGVRRDASGFAFTRDVLEAVVSLSDPFAAAMSLRDASRVVPQSLPVTDRLAVQVGGVASLGLPWAVLPVARRWLRDRLAPLALAAKLPDGTDGAPLAKRLRETLAAHADAGVVTVLALRGDAVLGPAGVDAEVARLSALARRPEVTDLAVDPARLVAGGSDWSADRDVQLAALALRPALAAAAAHGTAIHLEPRDYRRALDTTEVLVRALADAAFDDVDAGVTLPAELPESRTAAERLIRVSKARVRSGGAPLTVTVALTGLAGREQIASLLSGFPVPTLVGRGAQEAQWIRLVDLLLGAAAKGAVRVVAATENPHLAAAALELADRHGASGALEFQVRAGLAPALVDAWVAEGRRVRVRLPLMPSNELTGALDEVLTLVAEAADPESTLTRLAEVIEGARDPADPLEEGRDGAHPARARGAAELTAERAGFGEALAVAYDPFPSSHRTQQRDREWDPSERDSALFYRSPEETQRVDTGGLTAAVLGLTRDDTGQLSVEVAGPARPVPVISASGFANEPDTDATVATNREWARRVLARASGDRAAGGAAPSPAAATHLGDLVGQAVAVAEPWAALRPTDRATRVRRLALGTVAARDRLLAALAAESGGPARVLDREVSGAVDAVRYLGQLAAGLGAIRGAEFVADRAALVVVGPGIPLDERAEALAAVVATGAAALCVVHAGVERSTRALVEEWEASGLPDGLITVLREGGTDAPDIAADPRTDRALVLGHREAAEALVRRRPDLRVSGNFRALGSTLIAPSAEVSSAVRDAVESAFGAGHASAQTANVLVLLGSAARSKRLRAQLADAVRALRVGDSASPGDQDPLIFDVGPLPEPVGEAGRRALTELQPGEAWLVEPEQLDEAGRLWQPGVRLGVKPDSPFWEDAVGVPVLGVVTARSLDEAIAVQSRLGGGGVAALHATDAAEILPWLERVSAASLVVGRATTGAWVERHPVGGWGRAEMGGSPLAGGPNRLVTLGSWRLREGTRSQTLHLRGLEPEVQALIETAQASLAYEQFDLVRRAALSDALAWRTALGGLRDSIGLGIERNVVRRWPVPTHVRLAEGGDLADLLRVLAAALLVAAPVTVSTGSVLPPEVRELLATQGVPVLLERDEAWLERIAVHGPGGTGGEVGADAEPVSRVRLIGGDRTRAAEWMGGLARVTLWADPVTMAGPVELLAFVREQSISVTAHRHGLAAPVAGVDQWIAELDAALA